MPTSCLLLTAGESGRLFYLLWVTRLMWMDVVEMMATIEEPTILCQNLSACRRRQFDLSATTTTIHSSKDTGPFGNQAVTPPTWFSI